MCYFVKIGSRVVELTMPGGQQLHRIEPQRVDLDGLSSPGRDDPIANLRVHPGQWQPGIALRQEAVGIHVNAESRALHMKSNDFVETWQQRSKGVQIVADRDVTVDGVEKPERGVGGVVKTIFGAFRKEIWEKAIA